MRKYLKWIIIFIIVVVVLILINVGTDIVRYKGSFPYDDVSYSIPLGEYCSCLHLWDDNVFSEYDCESEPSSMPFSGEFYDRYYYDKKNNVIIFKGRGRKNIKASVLKWTDDELKIKVLNSSQEKNYCASNGKDIYTYYKNFDILLGKKVRSIISNFNDDELNIDFSSYNNYEKECGECKFATTSEILDKIEDNEKYSIEYYRDEDGKITGIYIKVFKE